MTSKKVLTTRFEKMNDPTDVQNYCALSGYEGLKKALKMEKENILEELEIALLRGRGGAAFPLGKKWRHLFYSQGSPKYIVCNADEGEPGTFKDKALLDFDPLALIEGMTIAGYLFDSPQGYIYIRGEYRHLHDRLNEALNNARQMKLLEKNILGISGFDYDIRIISGAGAYVCGEN
ncbi:hypothetical protein TEHD86_1499 [Tetragenococcus halophilus subsp. halophilus]|nr:hypothetical protein [Tetragenococcus halophilus]GBD59524.1 hypothetical protein TEHN0098T_1520 [Tetragenococcus halophilus subsp. halophilus]GBD80159.1 hypothetical protein TEHD10_1222 [Tetragenococcus halophilus subsp. halophilus]GBD82777.1 hypothetical protein TEHD86_1499 [Tetragenococcus halophilus subsp. halophilus]GFK20963.1 hypothetical protein WJ7_04260 [Tetragenococcus halophilus]GMA44681.1 hypothetical protein GCM10025853_21380 [Tetragenococcus halophilus subsp. halophilus DSM 203